MDTLKTYTADLAKTITTRPYEGTNIRRDATPEEADIIQRILYGAMRTIESGGCTSRDIDVIACTAEFICKQFLPDVNCYKTIHLPILRWAASQ